MDCYGHEGQELADKKVGAISSIETHENIILERHAGLTKSSRCRIHFHPKGLQTEGLIENRYPGTLTQNLSSLAYPVNPLWISLCFIAERGPFEQRLPR